MILGHPMGRIGLATGCHSIMNLSVRSDAFAYTEYSFPVHTGGMLW